MLQTFRLRVGICILGLIAAHAASATGQEKVPWSQLSLSTCGIDKYLEADATHDGRGIIIAVLDTGVDMGVPGLQKTSTGEVKVIDVQDFSTQGDIEIHRALWSDDGKKIVHYDKKGNPEFFTPPTGDKKESSTVWFAMLDESRFTNSSVPDVNDNGKKDDSFALCVISDDNGGDDDAACYIDTNLNRDFSDDQPFKNYKLSLDSFTFPREKVEKQQTLLTCGLNIFVKERRVSIHFDDGGHGTHVAGIAAGCGIQGHSGFNGVAPGARVISLKIGHNTLAGGATTTGAKKKAFEYAARYARENNVTVVCNLSYGVGSVREGLSEVDEFVEDILRKNPGLILCTSAGNAGPGLSSVGTPAAAPSAISVGALIAVDTAQDVRGEKIDLPQLTEFSSRGGEICKPDIVTPGMTTSTVPRWNHGGDFWQGTSMASPYAAGMAALLAQKMRSMDVTPRADWIKLALQTASDLLPLYTALDQGAGIPNIGRAAKILESIVNRQKGSPLFGFEVSTESPLTAKGTAPAAYWRTSLVPMDRPQTFTINPVFAPVEDAMEIVDFSKRLMLRSETSWCKVTQGQIYFRDRQPATVSVEYDGTELRAPGLYVATIYGTEDGLKFLRLVNTVIVPYRASLETNYEVDILNQSVRGWELKRHFVEVPPGATAMHITMKAIEGQESSARMYYIFGPNGHSVGRRYPVRVDTRNSIDESTHTIFEDLTPGIWELPVSSTKPSETSSYQIKVRFDGVVASPEQITNLSSEDGSKPSGKVSFTNVFDIRTNVRLEGQIEGYRKSIEKKMSPDKDEAEFNIEFTEDIQAARIKVELSDEDYARLTDCAVNVLDSAGKAFVQSGLDGPELTVTAQNPTPGKASTCKLKIQPAFTLPKLEKEAEFKIKIDSLYAKPIAISVKRGETNTTTLYTGVPTECSYNLDRVPPKPPKDTKTVGYIRAVDTKSEQPISKIEICGD